ncbi:hypothetical protein BH09PLA1_BH09PLA1_19430 [soil metagenome]
MSSRMIRTTLLTVILAISGAALRGDAPAASDARDSADSVAAVSQNYGVRLRKLHLVRPDLIPYPLSLEVYC